ncbi:hypothetical protein GY45DRAFT_149899 [Cubamyces sp. BRFM 1775]|nr:hypothetical protein GY45DRAFT_149899 [Cubamyces sp. BRFM 1775]
MQDTILGVYHLDQVKAPSRGANMFTVWTRGALRSGHSTLPICSHSRWSSHGNSSEGFVSASPRSAKSRPLSVLTNSHLEAPLQTSPINTSDHPRRLQCSHGVDSASNRVLRRPRRYGQDCSVVIELYCAASTSASHCSSFGRSSVFVGPCPSRCRPRSVISIGFAGWTWP